jgi:hypothetical protein
MFCWLVYALASCRGAASPWIWTLLLTELEAGDSDSEPEGVLITGTSAGFSHLVGNVSAMQSVHLGNSISRWNQQLSSRNATTSRRRYERDLRTQGVAFQYSGHTALVIRESQAAIPELFAQHPVLLEQVVDHLALMLVHPSGNSDEQEWEGIENSRHLPSVGSSRADIRNRYGCRQIEFPVHTRSGINGMLPRAYTSGKFGVTRSRSLYRSSFNP